MNRRQWHLIACISLLWAGLSSAAFGQTPTPAELAQKSDWVKQHLCAPQDAGPAFFSFTFAGQPADTLLRTWQKKATQLQLDPQRIEHSLTWTDAASGLVVRCRAVEYLDFPTVEWTLYFQNTGTKDSAIISDIRALDIRLIRTPAGEFTLHHHTGDNCSAHSYEPHETRLDPRSSRTFAPDGGRPTNGAYPFFNLAFDDGGLIAVVGWPGQWSATFARDDASSLRLSAGQELTSLKLLPGEQIRTPLVALQFWKGDRVRSQNIWRRWMIAHNLPRPAGKLPPPFTSSCMGLHQNEAGEIGYIDAYLKGGVKLDYWWMDAGWYPCRDWPETGTWEPDPNRFPRGIRAVSDHAHANDMKLVLWFEPERVHPGTWLYEKHPEWLLGKDGNRLLNLGNPEARNWLTTHIDNFLNQQGIDLYRQDFNIDPLGFWRANDAPDRRGITEIRYVEGYLAYWDELLKRHPGMLIDSCASGGRRNDLETLRRSVPLLRSDFQAPQNPNSMDMMTGNQGHTYGLSSWVPYYGTGVFYDNVYAFRSHLTPALGIGFTGPADKVDWPKLRRRYDDWKTVADFFYGDYYPLTPYTLAESAWIGWQFQRPETGDGMIQAFRHSRSLEESITLKLCALRTDSVYEIRDLDSDSTTRFAGSALMATGLPVKLPGRAQAALLTYKRVYGPAAAIACSAADAPVGGAQSTQHPTPASDGTGVTSAATCEVLQELTFSARASAAPGGAIAGYKWDFGDGASATTVALAHTYDKPGTYAVRLTVTDARGQTDTARLSIVVSPPDTTLPAIAAVASGNSERVVVTFNKPLDRAAAETAANYTIDPSVKIISASLARDRTTVTLTTSPLSDTVTYALTVRNIRDIARTPHTIVDNAARTFRYSGLFGWWRLDDGAGDTAADASGNGNPGLLRGDRKSPKWVQTERGTVLSFSGDGDFVETASNLPDLAMPFSITLWVRPAATQVEHADIFGNHGEPFVGISLQQDGTQTNKFGFGYGDGKKWQGTGHAQLKADQWQHLAIVCDGKDSVLYIDGVEKIRGPGQGPVAANPNQNFKLGQGYHSGRYFRGQISDVRIHRKALSAAEVGELLKPPPPAPKQP
ncbi:MAG: LamG-like jellyroll fold domain-containing protein [Tepidisphaerales bacterium]